MVAVADKPNDFSEELTQIRKDLGWSIRTFASRLRVPEDRYKNWEYGKVKKEPANVMAKARQFLHDRENASVQEKKHTGFAMTVAIPAWRGVLGGNSLEDEAVYEREEDPEEIPSAFLVRGIDGIELHDVIKVSGNSMYPRVESGERIIIFRDSIPRANTIVFAASPEGRQYIKCLRQPGRHFILDSYAEDGLTVENIAGWTIYGYAIAILGPPGMGSRNIEWNEGRPLRA